MGLGFVRGLYLELPLLLSPIIAQALPDDVFPVSDYARGAATVLGLVTFCWVQGWRTRQVIDWIPDAQERR